MNRYIRGLDDIDRLEKVLKAIGYIANDERDAYYFKGKKKKYNNIIYILGEGKICISFYNRKCYFNCQTENLELRVFSAYDIASIEIVYIDNNSEFYQELLLTSDKEEIAKMLAELDEFMEDEEWHIYSIT